MNLLSIFSIEQAALLARLAMGKDEIEKGLFRPAEDVFAELDEEDRD